MDKRNKKINKGKKWDDNRKNKYISTNIDPDDNYNELSNGAFDIEMIKNLNLEEEEYKKNLNLEEEEKEKEEDEKKEINSK